MEILSDEQYNLYYDNKETEIKFIKNIGTLRKQSITNFILTVFDIFSQNKERYLWLRQIKKKNNRVSSVTYYKFLACFKSLEAFIQSKDDVFLIDYTFVLGENMKKEIIACVFMIFKILNQTICLVLILEVGFILLLLKKIILKVYLLMLLGWLHFSSIIFYGFF